MEMFSDELESTTTETTTDWERIILVELQL